MNHRRVIRQYLRGLHKIHARQLAESIATEFAPRCHDLLENRPLEANRSLDRHLCTWILPGIALFEAYGKLGYSEPDILESMGYLFAVLARPNAVLYRILGHIPGFWRLFRPLVRLSMARGFPESGWKRQWREDSKHSIAFDMQSCYYQDRLREHSRENLLPLYCRTDDILYGSMSQKVSWERTTTLGRGGKVCNFRFSCTSARQKGERP